MHPKYICIYILFIVFATTSCDSMMTVIDVEPAAFPPKLSVTAILDTDGDGHLSIRISKGHSISSAVNWYEEKFSKGTITLYEDEKIIKFIQRDSIYTMYNGYYARFTGIPSRAGSTYRLEVTVDGYETVTATSVMPADPVFHVELDTTVLVYKNNVCSIRSLSDYYGSASRMNYWPIKLSLTDNSPNQDYYSFQMDHFYQSDNEMYPNHPYLFPRSEIGTSNIALLQDNPDIEARNLLFDMGGEAYDTYMFDLMLISDITFANTTAHFDFYTDSSEKWKYHGKMPGYSPEIHGLEVKFENRTDLIIRHITKETFQNYRSLALQWEDLAFLTEPVSVISNIQNGYGCFSTCNSKRISLIAYETYYYPERYGGYYNN